MRTVSGLVPIAADGILTLLLMGPGTPGWYYNLSQSKTIASTSNSTSHPGSMKRDTSTKVQVGRT